MRNVLLTLLTALIITSCGSNPTVNDVKDQPNSLPIEQSVKNMPRVATVWAGYQENNVIKTINTDFKITQSAVDSSLLNYLLKYTRNRHLQTKDYQNTYLYFYQGNAPMVIPFEEHTVERLSDAFNYIKQTDPYMTIWIYGRGKNEMEYYYGFSE
jgi:hypothetical protein